MLHPERIFYFAYAPSVDPLTLVGKKLQSIAGMRAVLPSYTCVKRVRSGKETIRKQTTSTIEGLVYAFTMADFRTLEKHAGEFDKRSLYVMMLDTNLLQEVLVYTPKVQRHSAQFSSL